MAKNPLKTLDAATLNTALYKARGEGYTDDEVKSHYQKKGMGFTDDLYNKALAYKPTIQKRAEGKPDIDVDAYHSSVQNALAQDFSPLELRNKFAERGIDFNDYYSSKDQSIRPLDDVPRTPWESDVRRYYEEEGGGYSTSFKRGMLGALQTTQGYMLAGLSPGRPMSRKEGMGVTAEGDRVPVSPKEYAEYLKKQERYVGLIKGTEEEIRALPVSPTIKKVSEASKAAVEKVKAGGGGELDQLKASVKAWGGTFLDSPNKLHFFGEQMVEQFPTIFTTIVATKGLGGVARAIAPLLSTTRAVQMGVMAGGAGAGSFSATFGSNVSRALEKGLTPDEAVKYAGKRSSRQSFVDMATGAVMPFKIGGHTVVNVPAQTAIQMVGGGYGEYTAALAVGETPDIAEVTTEAFLELLGGPIEVATAYSEGRAARAQRRQLGLGNGDPVSDGVAGEPDVTDGDVDVTDGDVDVADGDVDVTDGDVDVADGDVDVVDGEPELDDGEFKGDEKVEALLREDALLEDPESVTGMEAPPTREGVVDTAQVSEVPPGVAPEAEQALAAPTAPGLPQVSAVPEAEVATSIPQVEGVPSITEGVVSPVPGVVEPSVSVDEDLSLREHFEPLAQEYKNLEQEGQLLAEKPVEELTFDEQSRLTDIAQRMDDISADADSAGVNIAEFVEPAPTVASGVTPIAPITPKVTPIVPPVTPKTSITPKVTPVVQKETKPVAIAELKKGETVTLADKQYTVQNNTEKQLTLKDVDGKLKRVRPDTPAWDKVQSEIARVEAAPTKVTPLKVKPGEKFSLKKAKPEEKIDTIVNEIFKEAKRINPTAEIELFEKMFGSGEALSRSAGGGVTKLQEVAGSYTPLKNLIEISMDIKKFDPLNTTYHELWHSLETMFTPREQALLQKSFPGKNGISHDEHAAIEFADWARGQNGKKLSAAIRRIFTKLKQLLRNLGNKFIADGFTSPEDVFIEAMGGDIIKRKLGQDEAAYKKFSTIQEGMLNHVQDVDIRSKIIADETSTSTTSMKKLMNKATTYLTTARDFYQDYRDSPELEKALDLHWFENALVYPRNLAKKYPTFARIWEKAVSMFEMRDTMAAELGYILESYYSLSTVAKQKINGVLELGRLRGIEFEADAHGEIKVTNNDKARAQNIKVGETVTLNPTEVKGYQSVREAMTQALEAFKDMVIEQSGFDPVSSTLRSSADVKAYREDLVKQAGGNKKKLADLEKDIVDLNALADNLDNIEEAQRTGYIPFSRFGNHAVVVRNEKGEVVERVHFEVSKFRNKKVEIKRKIDELEKAYPTEQGYEISKPIRLNSQSALQEIDFNINSLDALVDTAGMQNQYYGGFREGLEKELQKRGFKKHFFRSHNTAGYTPNFERAIGEYVVGMSSYIARRRHAPAFQKAVKDIDIREQPKLRKYAEDYIDYVQSPIEEYNRIRQIAFSYYLINPSTALVNLSQVPMLTMPYLTQFTNVKNITKEFTIAYNDARKMLSAKGGLLNLRLDPKLAPIDLREDFIRADADGHLVPQETFDLMSIAHSMKPRLVKGQDKLGKIVQHTAKIYSSAERINRVATYIAVHRLGQKLIKNPKFQKKVEAAFKDNALWKETSKDGLTPDLLAKWVIDETHYKLGKVNRAKWFRGIGAPLLQFKSFTAITMHLLYDLAFKQGAGGKLAFATTMGMFFMASGLEGLPFLEDAKDVFEALYKGITDEDLDVENWLKLQLAEIFDGAMVGDTSVGELITKGLFRATPIDVQSRLSLGHVLPVSALKAMMGNKDVTAMDVIRDVGGVSADLFIGKPNRAIEAAKNNRPGYEVFAQLAPKLMENLIASYGWSQNGVVSGRNARMRIPKEELDAVDIAAKAFGFTPTKVSQKREQAWSETRYANKMNDVRSRFYTRMAKAIVHKTEKLSDVLDEIREFNKGRILAEQIFPNRSYLKRLVQEERLGYASKRPRKQARAEIMRRRELLGQSAGVSAKTSPRSEARIAARKRDWDAVVDVLEDLPQKEQEQIIQDLKQPELQRLIRQKLNKRNRSIFQKILDAVQ